jgi:2-polyprenyl-6-methoxyphenol hydroxylase-like FAD-dependent oxidoreductase
MPPGATRRILLARAQELGVEIIQGVELLGISQDDAGVTATVRGSRRQWTERASYVVGCDGVDSAVRRLLGIAFDGYDYRFSYLVADVRDGGPPVRQAVVGHGPGGVAVGLGDGAGGYRIAGLDSGPAGTPWPDAMAGLLERLNPAADHELAPGHGPAPTVPPGVRRYPCRRRLASRYRAGRVLLAGDAAHEHLRLAGQGLNLGIHDAMTLGWLLATVAHGWAPPALLDRYERERRAAAARDMAAVDRALRVLTGTPRIRAGVAATAVRRLLGVGSHGGPGAGYAADINRAGRPVVAGPVADGRWMPDLDLVRPDRTTVRLYDLLREGRFVMVDLSPDSIPAMVAGQWGDRVRAIVADLRDPLLLPEVTALLVRPDGYLAWFTRAADRRLRAGLCEQALRQWCGPGPLSARSRPLVAPAPRRVQAA